jgi:hypothetical protein
MVGVVAAAGLIVVGILCPRLALHSIAGRIVGGCLSWGVFLVGL